MSPDKDKALCEKYPLIFVDRHADRRSTPMCWGFDCDDGWYFLIDALCEKLQSLTDHNPHHKDFQQIVAMQVKEKYGGLRFYVQSSSDYQEGIISMVEALSYRTCEICGMPGKPNEGMGWIHARCEEHITKL